MFQTAFIAFAKPDISRTRAGGCPVQSVACVQLRRKKHGVYT